MTKFLILCMSVFMGLVSILPVNAKSDITIYDITYGKYLELYANEIYSELSDSQKNYYNSIPAYEILGYDAEDGEEMTIEMQGTGNARLSLVATTTAIATAIRSGDYVVYGVNARCNGFVSPKIVANVVLIRDSDGKIMASSTETKTTTSFLGISESEKVAKLTNDFYYSKAAVLYYAPDSTWVPSTTTVTCRSGGVN